jgi:UDP-N-acetylglucosamine 1-carboxyvinyltransferase
VYVDWNPFERRVCIEAKAIEHASVNAARAGKLRASIALACPLLHRCKWCRIPFPGGDPIGKRPLDEMMRGIEILGGEVHTEVGWYDVRLARDLQGTSIHLRYPSHTATMALMMLGAVARGTTIIYNAAQEPEVKDMQQLLCSMQAKVTGAGTSVIMIEGCSSLGRGEMEVMLDRLQIGTYLLAIFMTEGSVRMPSVYVEHLQALIEWLQEAGVQMKPGGDGTVEMSGMRPYRAVSFATAPYPGFPTDLQAPMMAFLAVCEGCSVVRENVFEQRLLHVAAMQQLGVQATILSGRDVLITGSTAFQAGKMVQAQDIRGGAALLLCALSLQGHTMITNAHHLLRGYPQLVAGLRAIGATIELQEEREKIERRLE